MSGDETLGLSPDCQLETATYSPPPATVRIYPCAAGTGAVSVRYAEEGFTWVRPSQVLAPRFSYPVTVTSQDSAAPAPNILWRSLSWLLYRDGLVALGNVVVVEELAGGGLRPLYYREPATAVAPVTVVVCALDNLPCAIGTTPWSNPPRVGDQVYFLGTTPIALLSVTMQEGRQATPWVLDWHYGTVTGWEALPNPHDGTEGLRKTGTVVWDAITERPMAPRVVAPLTADRYAVRATVASAGTGAYTPPSITTVGAQSGRWSATLSSPLSPGAATALRVYVLPVDTVAVGDYRRDGPEMDLVVAGVTADVGPWRPWTAPAASTQPTGPDVGAPPAIANPIPSDGGGLPLVGFVVERASASAAIPSLFLWTLIGFGAAFAVLVAAQKATGNIMVSVIAGGVALAVLTGPFIGISSVWVVMVYGLIGATVVVIGNRLQV